MDQRTCRPTLMNFARNFGHPLLINRQDIKTRRSRLQAPIPHGTNANSSRGVYPYLPWIRHIAVALGASPFLSAAHHVTNYSTDRIPVADVQVEPAVMNTPYGNKIKKDPSVILRALAISLELGVSVTLKFADATAPPSSRGCKSAEWRPGTIVYIGTHDDGRQETLGVTN